MKAAILEKLNHPLTIADVGLTDLLRGQVLVKVLVSGICGAQLQEIAGNKGNAKFVPHLLGHEGCGIVENVGPDVTTVEKGDKVVLHWRKGDGIESDFPTYVFNGKEIRSGKVTTFSEYSIVSENRVTAVPHDVPTDFCALLGCGLSTALGTIDNEAKVSEGESVMIIGCGGLGASLIKAARLAGAKVVIAVDIHGQKEEAALQLGAHIFINSTSDNVRSALKEKMDTEGVDVIVDTSGNPESISSTIPILNGGGRYILLGQPKPEESIEIVNACHMFEGEGKTIKATQGGQFSPSRDIPNYIALYRDGSLTTDNLITHRVSLDDINEGISLMRKGEVNRVFIDIWQ